MDLTPLFALVIISILLERFLAVFFDIVWVSDKLKVEIPDGGSEVWRGHHVSLKGLIAAVVGVAFCLLTGFDVINPLIVVEGVKPLEPAILAQFITGVIIAGGSQGSVKLFQDVLGFSKTNRDAVKALRRNQEEVQRIRTENDKAAASVERLRHETELVRLVGRGGGSSDSANSSGTVASDTLFDSATDDLLMRVVPNSEDRAVLRRILADVRNKKDARLLSVRALASTLAQ